MVDEDIQQAFCAPLHLANGTQRRMHQNDCTLRGMQLLQLPDQFFFFIYM
jgi:hypothetical protein